MALRNRKHLESNKLRGVNRVDDESDIELGTFEELSNLVPSDIFAIKKKRGTSPLNPGALAMILTEDEDFIISESGSFLITEL